MCPQHTSQSRQEVTTRPARSGVRARNSGADEQPYVGNYRLLKTIGKGNFAKVKLARHILTGREVRRPLKVFPRSCRYDAFKIKLYSFLIVVIFIMRFLLLSIGSNKDYR